MQYNNTDKDTHKDIFIDIYFFYLCFYNFFLLDFITHNVNINEMCMSNVIL